MAPQLASIQTGTAASSATAFTPQEGYVPQTSEARFRHLFEAAPHGILVVDAESGTITAANSFLARLLGYSDTELPGRKLWEICPFEGTGKGRIAFRELQNRDLRYDDLPLETRDGRSVTVEFVSNVFQSGHDRLIQCNIRDVTNRDARTKASDARYRTLFECAPDGIIISDREGRYVDVNASICRMLGYSRSELIGLHASDIVAPDEVPHLNQALASIATSSEYRREYRFRRKDSSVFAVDVMATGMPDGHVLAIIRDVTERNRALDAVLTSKARTQFALEGAHVGIWDQDYTTGTLQWSDVMEAQYGLQPGTFGGTFEAWVERIHPDDRSAVIQTVGNAMRTGSDFIVVNRTILPDTTVRWLSGAGRIILDERRQPLRAVGISQDVTERHTLEAQFQQAQKMEAIGRLAGGVAHDFNNLLTIILGFCEILLQGTDAADPRQADIEQIQTAGARAAGLTRQLLAFSRKEIIEPTLLDLNAVLGGMQPMLGRLLRENVKIVLKNQPGLSRIKADRGQLEQVVMNLVVNAQDAMPDGGTLTIETANAVLDERYATMRLNVRPGPFVVLTVTDSGTGMTPAVREHLFEPFFTTKEVGKGTGLGLATVYGIVTRCGGGISVYSEIDRGTSFDVYFPKAASADTVVDTPEETALPSNGTERVLLVEDDTALRELTRRLLERQGYVVVAAANGAEALRRFEDQPAFDALLTDVVMPGRSGPNLAKQLAERQPGLKVVYMSGYTEEAVVQRGVLNPGIAFLRKPFTAGALGRKLRSVLDA